MRIVLVTDSLPPLLNGVSTSIVEIARAFEEKGHEVLILAADQKSKIKIPELKTTKIAYFPSIPIMFYTNFRVTVPNAPSVSLAISKFKPDVIHSLTPSPLGLDCLMAAKLMKIPFVNTFTTLVNSKEYVQMILKMKYTKAIQDAISKYFKWYYNRSDLVLAETPEMKKIMIKTGIKEKLIQVGTSPFDFYNFREITPSEKLKIQEKFQFGPNSAVYMGRVSAEKNLMELIDIWILVLKEIKDAKLYIIGSGPLENDLKAKILKLNLGEHIKMLGGIPHSELINSGILAAADVFISPSTSETLGLAALESMACNLPVVLYKTQGVAEFINDEGIVLEKNNHRSFAEAILKLLSDKSSSQLMGQKARLLASKFGGEQSISRYLSFYENIINK